MLLPLAMVFRFSDVLFYCSLTNSGIPVTLPELGNLRAIGLKRNNLTAVPLVLGSMQSLQEIYLENNSSLEVFQRACPSHVVMQLIQPRSLLIYPVSTAQAILAQRNHVPMTCSKGAMSERKARQMRLLAVGKSFGFAGE